jgi:hypothetical protein
MGMAKTMAWAVALALCAIAVLHLYWGLGGFWPGHDEASLVDMVIGAPPGTPIPPFWACLVVVVCLMLPAIAATMIANQVKLPKLIAWMPHFALWFSAFVFVARGLSTYFSPLVLSAKGTAFFELDRVIYAPICFGLGLGLVAVWFMSRAGRAG